MDIADVPRDKYVERCKQRAFDHLDRGDLKSAVSSFVNNMDARSDCELPHHLASGSTVTALCFNHLRITLRPSNLICQWMASKRQSIVVWCGGTAIPAALSLSIKAALAQRTARFEYSAGMVRAIRIASRDEAVMEQSCSGR